MATAMESINLVDAIREGKDATDGADEEVIRVRKFIVFSIEDKIFALPADDVQEIRLDLSVYYLPFLPPYLPGLINRLGEPYVLMDLQYLFSRKQLDAQAFLILKAHISKLAILITAVQDIVTVPETNIRQLSASLGPMDAWIEGFLDLKGREVFLLSVKPLVAAVSEAFHN